MDAPGTSTLPGPAFELEHAVVDHRLGLLRQRRPQLFLFFAFPIVMIGYPSIKSVSIKNDLFSLEKTTHELQKDPTNAPLRNSLTQQVAQVTARPMSSPDALAQVGIAKFALGDHAGAEANLQKVLQQSVNLPLVAVELKNRIDVDRRLAAQSAQLEQHPADAAVKESLQRTVSEATRLSVASPVLLANIARAQAVVGNQAAAQSLADKALTIDPSLTTAKQVQMQIRATKIQP